ncbi:TATA-box-binding protein [Candidatus Woesearchaeota archaeon]|nr:TATA-box-binding protein [Candidatus Woesearchaeota archaeon]
MAKTTVVNMVISTALEEHINLDKLASTLPNTEYNPEQFPGLIMRIKDPKTSALIFTSGRVVCTGAKNMADAERSVQNIIESLKKIKVHIKIKPILHVQNMVAAGSLGYDLNLNKLAITLNNVEYEPEQFPGLVYKIKSPKTSFLLFGNGKIVVTGIKNDADLVKSVEVLEETLGKVMDTGKKKK